MHYKGAMVTVRLTWDEKKLLGDLGGACLGYAGSITKGFKALIDYYRRNEAGDLTPRSLLVDPKDLVESKCDDRLTETGEDYSFGRNDGLAPSPVEQEPEKAAKKRKSHKSVKPRSTPQPAPSKNGRLKKKGKK